MRKRKLTARIGFYLLGLLILAIGLTFNTKAGLGVAPLISVPYAAADIWDLNFGDLVFLFYCLMAAAQFWIKGKNRRWSDLLQVVLSLLFSRLLNLLALWLPAPGALWLRVLTLLAAVICIGVGSAMSVNARLIPNPADGLVHALTERTGKDMGLIKNLCDGACMVLALLLGLLFAGRIVGVHVGTVVTVLLTGRVVWLYNRLCKVPLDRWTGLDAAASEE